MAISTNGTIITRLAGALYGEYLSNATYTELNTTTASTVAANMLSNDFAGKTDAQLATTILTNLGLTTVAGLNNWVAAQLTAAGTTAAAKGAKLVSMLNDYAMMTADATYGASATSFNAKTAASLTLSQTTGNLGGSFATADVVAVKPQTFSLTTGTDSFTGTSANDTFDAQLNTSGNQTYSPSDTVIGGSGTDTLNANITVAGQGTFVPTASAMSGIEVFNVSGAGAAVFNLTNVSGLTSLVNSANSNSVTFTNTDATVPVTIANTTGATVVNLKTNTLTGTTDALTVNLQGLGTNSTLTVADVTLSATDTSALETLNFVTSNTASTLTTLTVSTSGVSTINVSGDQDLTITTITDGTAAGVAAKTINASTLTGSLTVTGPHNTLAQAGNTITGGAGNDALTGGFGNDVISGGDGNDTITISTGNDSVSGGAGNDGFTVSTNLTVSDTIDGGDGTDTLTTSGAITGTAGSKVTNVETIAVDAAVEVDLSTLTGVTTVRSTSIAAGTTTFSGLAGTEALSIRSAVVGNATVVTATKAVDGTADSLAVTIGNATATAGVVLNTLNANDAETITITSSSVANTISTLASTDATKLTVAGSVGLTVSAFTGSSALKTIDASAATAAFIMGAAIGTSGVTLTGGTGADSLIGSAGNDVISGGDGADVVSIGGAGGNDSISGGAGNDIFFSVNALTSDITATDTIAGGDGTDSIQFGDTAVAGQATYDLTASGILGNVSGIERIVLQDGTQAVTLTVGDDIVGIAGNSLTISANQTGRAATIVNSTLSSTSTVTATQAVAGQILTYTLGNSIDKATGNTAADVFIVGTTSYLSASDAIKGGTNTDTLRFTSATASTVTAAQLAGVSSVESFSVVSGTTNQFTFTLTDAVVGANYSGTSFAVTRASDTSTGALKVTGSAVTTYALALTGDAGADTLIGGTGADTISGGLADGANDSLTGGTGNDTFILDNGAGIDTISDLEFGTAAVAGTTNYDVLSLVAVAADAAATFDTTPDAITTVTTGVTGIDATTDAVIYSAAVVADAAAMDTIMEALAAATVVQDFVVFYQTAFGQLRAAVVESDGSESGADYTVTDVAIIGNYTLTTLASALDIADFTTA